MLQQLAMVAWIAMVAGFAAGMGITMVAVAMDDKRQGVKIKNPFKFPTAVLGVSLVLAIYVLYLVVSWGSKTL